MGDLENREKRRPYTTMPATVYSGIAFVIYAWTIAFLVAAATKHGAVVLLAQWAGLTVLWFIVYFCERVAHVLRAHPERP